MAGIIVGLVAAWRAEAATSALVAGAALLVLAVLLTPDLEELSGRYKDAEFAVRRRGGESAVLAEVRETLGVIQQSVANTPAEGQQQAIRQWMEDVASQIGRIDRAQAQSRRAGLIQAIVDRLHRHPDKPADYAAGFPPEVEGGAVRLALETNGGPTAMCVVRKVDHAPPAQSETESMWEALAISLGGTGSRTFTVVFPEEFPGAPPLKAGDYKVEWREVSWSAEAGEVRPRFRQGPILVTDEFSVPAEFESAMT